jgi:alpha-acetolactate decarboxylase
MLIVDRFAKHLESIEYPKEKTSWNIAGIIKGQNAFYKFDVRGMIKESKNRAYQNRTFKYKSR